jgi:phytol kinase
MGSAYNRCMLLYVLASLVAILLLLLVTEQLWRKGKLEVETSRKIVHMGTGVLVSSWPHYLDWIVVQILSLALLVVVLVSYKLHIFKSIHSIKRLTIGELLYPVGIGVCALLMPAPWVFTVAVLHLTLADGLAAIMGVKYGARTRYNLLSHGKSLVGSATFFLVSYAIFVVSSFVVSENSLPHFFGMFVAAALVLTAVENISWYGLDDVTVPLATIVLLTYIAP